MFALTPNTDALLSPQRQESGPNRGWGIQGLRAHIKDVPTTHRAVLIPQKGTHTPDPIIFHSHSFQALFFLCVRFSNLAVFQACVFGQQAFFSQLPSFPSLHHRPSFDPVLFSAFQWWVGFPSVWLPCPVTDGHQATETKSL